MLILVRRRGESLKIGDNIELQIRSVVGKKVKLGISAPPEIPVHREEIHQHSQKNQQKKCKPC